MKCNHCGAEVPDDSIFCEQCGKKIEKAAEAKSKRTILILCLVAVAAIAVVLVFVLSSNSTSDEKQSTKNTSTPSANEVPANNGESGNTDITNSDKPVKEAVTEKSETDKEDVAKAQTEVAKESAANLDKPDRNGVTVRNRIKNGDSDVVKYVKLLDQMLDITMQEPSAYGFVQVEIIEEQMSQLDDYSEEEFRKACASIGLDPDALQKKFDKKNRAKWEKWANEHGEEIIQEEERRGLN